MIDVNGAKLHKAIKDSSFTFTQVERYTDVSNAYFNKVKDLNRINEDVFEKTCHLLGLKKAMFVPVKRQTYVPPEQKPVYAKDDPNQNWMINIYRAIEDMNDRLDIMIHELKENTTAVRALALKEGKDVL